MLIQNYKSLEEVLMGARQELNKHHVVGGLGLAGLLGLVTGS